MAAPCPWTPEALRRSVREATAALCPGSPDPSRRPLTPEPASNENGSFGCRFLRRLLAFCAAPPSLHGTAALVPHPCARTDAPCRSCHPFPPLHRRPCFRLSRNASLPPRCPHRFTPTFPLSPLASSPHPTAHAPAVLPDPAAFASMFRFLCTCMECTISSFLRILHKNRRLKCGKMEKMTAGH